MDWAKYIRRKVKEVMEVMKKLFMYIYYIVEHAIIKKNVLKRKDMKKEIIRELGITFFFPDFLEFKAVIRARKNS